MSTKTDEVADFLASPESEGLSNIEIGSKFGVHEGTVRRARAADRVAKSPMAVIHVDVGSIHVGNRFRKELGDIDALAESIAERGLLQPPVITTDHELVCGERRLAAVKQLGWAEVMVRVIDPDDMLLAERDENEVRKDFTPSEKVAIARVIADRIGSRQGQRTDLHGGTPGPVQNFGEVRPGERTHDVAARAAGFSNSETARQAEKVVGFGVPELVKAMDEGEVRISTAAEVAGLPRAEQAEVIARGPKAVKKKAKQLRTAKGSIVSDHIPELTDEEWLQTLTIREHINPKYKYVFDEDALMYRAFKRAIGDVERQVHRILNPKDPKDVPGYHKHGPYRIKARSSFAIPHPRDWVRCGICKATGFTDDDGVSLQCGTCQGLGYIVPYKGTWNRPRS